jgi:hypothetical protein
MKKTILVCVLTLIPVFAFAHPSKHCYKGIYGGTTFGCASFDTAATKTQPTQMFVLEDLKKPIAVGPGHICGYPMHRVQMCHNIKGFKVTSAS